MALLALAGMDHRHTLRSTDPIEVAVEHAIAARVLEIRGQVEAARLKSLAQNIGAHVSNNLAKILQRMR
jgi:hypothetical protein